MKTFLISLCFLLSFVSFPALADRIVQFDDAQMILTDKQCSVGVILANTQPIYRPQLKQGKVVFKAKDKAPLDLCYIEMDGFIYFMDITGYTDGFPSAVAIEQNPAPKGNKSI